MENRIQFQMNKTILNYLGNQQYLRKFLEKKKYIGMKRASTIRRWISSAIKRIWKM